MATGALDQREKKKVWVRSYPPQAPANLRISFISPSEVTFGWERPPLKGNESEEEKALLGYEIFYMVRSPPCTPPPATTSPSSRPPTGSTLWVGRGEARTKCMRG